MAEKPKTQHERDQFLSTGEGKYRDDVIPTIDVTQDNSVEVSGVAGSVGSDTEIINSGAVPAKSIVTRLEAEVNSGTAGVTTTVEGSVVANDFALKDTPLRKELGIRDGGVHVIPSGGSIVVNAEPTGGGSVGSVAVNAKVVPIE